MLSIKKILPWIIFILVSALLILLYSQRDRLNSYISEEIKSQTETIVQKSISEQVDSLYNYQSNKESYDLTFLEFGAKGCVACRKMEFVLDEVRQTYPTKVKVVFLNILQTQNQDMMKYYGIVAIPTQVLLDRSGEEYFRHTGFYSFEDLSKEFEIN